MEKKLPYDFDLWYDIKTEEQLEREYRAAVAKVEHLELLCAHHGITIKIPQ